MPRSLPAMLPILALLAAACAMPPPAPRSPSATVGRAPLDADELARESQRLRERAKSHLEEQQRRVERVGQRLLQTLPDHPNVRFVVVQGDSSINAGATFGEVDVTSGMLNFVRSDDEMAVVLGHELAHIEQGHVLKGTIGNLALGILATVVEATAPGTGQAAGGIGQLFLNHYTQSQEREADEIGLRYAYEAGYDPRAAEGLQERLAVEEPQSMTAGYFDTHPSSVERAVAARKEAEELLSHGPPPGRAEALALERRDESARMAAQDRRGNQGFAAARPPEAVAASTEPGEAPPPAGCRRGRVYAEMARDAKDPDEKKDLYRRALRFCPTLTEARRGLEETEPDPDGAAPFDTY